MMRYYFACCRNRRDAEPEDAIVVDAPNGRAAFDAVLREHPEVSRDQLTLILRGVAVDHSEAQ